MIEMNKKIRPQVICCIGEIRNLLVASKFIIKLSLMIEDEMKKKTLRS